MAKINKSKFLPPGTKRILHRRRIIDILNSHSECRLIWVSGHAAQGKTSLAATYVAQLSHPVIWINLEAAEKDLVQFFKVLVEALRPVLSPEDFDYLTSLPSVVAGVGIRDGSIAPFSGPLMERLSSPVTIVLDDYHQLSGAAPSHALVRELVYNAPYTIKWLILSKNSPPFSIDALRVKQEALELSNETLRFTVQEIQTLYEDLWQIRLNLDQYKIIGKATEGWTGGLILLAQTLMQAPEIQQDPDFDDFISRQITLDAFPFFQAEVLDPMPAPVRELLIQVSVLPEINRNVLVPLFDDPHIEQRLLEICDRHLFFSKTYDPDEGWIFRPHSLFREFLNDQWQRIYDETTRTDFLRRAARINLQKGFNRAAMDLLLASGDMNEFSAVLIDKGLSLWLGGDHTKLKHYLDFLPPSLLEKSPWLILFSGLTCRSTDPEASNRILQVALTAFEQANDVKGQIIAMASLLEISCLAGDTILPSVLLLEKAETFLTENPEVPSTYPFETCCLWNQISLIRACRGGNAAKRQAASLNSLRLANRLEHPILQFHAHVSNVNFHSITGNFSEARHHLGALDQLVRAYPYPQLKCMRYSALILFYLFGGKPASESELPRALKQFEQTIQTHNLFFFAPLYRSHELQYAVFIRDLDKARRFGADLDKHPVFSTVPFMNAFANMYLGNIYYRLRNYRKALSMLKSSQAVFTSELGFSDEHAHFVLSNLGIIWMHLGEFEKAGNALKSALSYFRESDNNLFRTDTLLAKALLAHRENKSGTIPKALKQAFACIKANGYPRMNIISDNDLAEAACLALEYEVEDAFEAATHVLSQTPDEFLPTYYDTLSDHPKKAVRETVFSVETARHLRTRPMLEIQTLGGFSVTRENEKEPVAWPQPLIRKFFLAVLCHDGEIMAEMLMEMLWPESPPEKQQRNFKVALHRLRKTIEPDMPKKHVASYLKHQDNRVRLNMELFRLDTDRFASLCTEAEAMHAAGNDASALKQHLETLELYKGDFLPHDIYLPWTEPIRQRLRNRWQHVARRTAGLLPLSRRFEEALGVYEQIIENGVTDEEIFLQIMKIYAELGRFDAVQSTYRQLCTILRDELDTEPSMEINTAYKSLFYSKKS